MVKNNLTAIVICKNEESKIEDCLRSLDFCDQIIIVDSGSVDQTVNISKKYTKEIYIKNSSDFSELRNYGLKRAKNNWVLYIDADERVRTELKKDIIEKINSNNFDVFYIKRRNFYFGKYEWPKIEKLERLFRKGNIVSWTGALHESPNYKGKIGELDGYLNHYTHSDLSKMLEKTILWSDVEARLRYDSNHPKMTQLRFVKLIFMTFWRYYVGEKGYRLGAAGLIESMYQSFSMFITYAKLWELQDGKSSDKT